MPNIPLLPFESVRLAAESLADTRVKSQLLAQLAQNLLLAEHFDTALQTLATIPLPQERRIALLTADFSLFPVDKIEPLVQLLQSHPQTNALTGSIALSMVDAPNLRSAWKLIDTAEKPFESEQQRYDFLEKVLPLIEKDDWEKAKRLYQTFTEGIHKDWAALALIKYLAKQQRSSEAETLIQSFVSPLRRSWAYWEICPLSPTKLADTFFGKAVEIIETAKLVSDTDEEKEMFATQLRILGRVAYQKGMLEQGEQLLEQSESIIASLKMPMQRYRLQCFLGKVLAELKLISAVQDYMPIEKMLASLTAGSDRSRVLVWLAEAGWDSGWEQAIAVLSVPERGIMESERAEQIAAVLNRFVSHHRGLKPLGDSTEDSVRLSGEEFETFYFSPFAETDCGC